MKKSRFTESQIVAILKEGEGGLPVAQLTRKHGISAATYYGWKSKVRRGRCLRVEAVAGVGGRERETEAHVRRVGARECRHQGRPKPKTLTPSARREAIRIMTEEHGVSVTRACQAARLSRAAFYKPGMDQMTRDIELVEALQAVVAEDPRWGFWKCHDRLRALGYGWNHKRVWRVYCQLRLNLPRRTKRRVPKRERQSMVVESRLNAVWALDIMRDTLYSGKVFLSDVERHRRGEPRGVEDRYGRQYPSEPRHCVPGAADRYARASAGYPL